MKPINKYQVEAITTLYKILRTAGLSHVEAVKNLNSLLREFFEIDIPTPDPAIQIPIQEEEA